MFIVRNRKYFYALSLVLVAASIVALAIWGLRPGLDFKGGSILEIEYATRPLGEEVDATLDSLSLGEYSVRETGDTGFIVRMPELTPASHDAVLDALSRLGDGAAEKRFNSIGPVLGKEAIEKSWMSIILVLLAIIVFITFAFRKVSKPVSSWKYGLMAVLGLAHNLVITAGAFATLGHFAGYEVDTLFVTALLVILGFSIHDTIVVFDRIRENLHREGKKSFEDIVGDSIGQTFIRSINTSLTTLFAVIALYVWGPESTKHFSLALVIGITAGTYSSIFLGSPLLVTWQKWQDKRAK